MRSQDSIMVTAWVQETLVRPWRAQKMTFEEIGLRLGCSKANAINIAKGKTGIGPHIEATIAVKMFGGSRDKLLAAAKKWWEKFGEDYTRNPDKLPWRVNVDPTAVNRIKAARYSALVDGIDDDVVDSWLSVTPGWETLTAGQMYAGIMTHAQNHRPRRLKRRRPSVKPTA